MKELQKLVDFYDLPMVVELKESIDFILTVLDPSTEIENIQPLLLFNALLSSILKDLTEDLDDENRVLNIIINETQNQRQQKQPPQQPQS